MFCPMVFRLVGSLIEMVMKSCQTSCRSPAFRLCINNGWGLDGIDNNNLDLGKFYTPLPEDGGSRLLEGVNAAGKRQ